MDFDNCLLQLQGCLISAHNSFNRIGDSISDAAKADILVDKVKKIMGKWCGNYDSHRACLYIICNSDLESLSYLSDDKTVGHIIGSAPCLSKYVVLHSILKLNLLSCLQDLMTFGPQVLSADLFETFVLMHSSTAGTLALDTCTQFIKACFHKIILCEAESFTVQFKFFKYFEQFVKIINNIKIDIKVKDDDPISDLYHLAGKVALSLLEICTFCVQEGLSDKSECWECYRLDCNFNFQEWLVPSGDFFPFEQLLRKCRDLIFCICGENLAMVTIDIWLSWVEVDITPSVTMQQCIGEAAYHCHQSLLAFNRSGQDLNTFEDLLSKLSQLSIKPRCEEDEVKESSLCAIIENLGNENKCKQIWLKGLLKHDEVLESADSILAIEKYSSIFHEEDIVVLLDKILSKLKDVGVAVSHKNTLFELALNIMKDFSLESHVNILDSCICDDSYGGDLFLESFPSLLHCAFNKIIDMEDEQNNSFCEAIRLCIFNPRMVVFEALKMGLEGQRQYSMMSRFLVTLRSVSPILIEEWLVNLRATFLFGESQVHFFPHFIAELVCGKVLSINFLLKSCVMPALYDDFSSGDFSLTTMWVLTLQFSLQNEDICSSQEFRIAPLLVFISQILGRCVHTVSTFNSEYLKIRDAALLLIATLKRTKLDDMEQQWLSIQIASHPSLVCCYLKDFTKESSVISEHDISEYCALKHCFPNVLQRTETAACILVEILPCLTANEWNYLADYFKESFVTKDDKSWIVFLIYRQCMLLLAAVSSSNSAPLDTHHLSCLNYCVRNFGMVLQDKILPSLNKSYVLTVLTETLQVLSKLPSLVWDGSVIFLSPLLTDLIQNAPKNSLALSQLRTVFSKCPKSEAQSLIEAKFLEMFTES